MGIYFSEFEREFTSRTLTLLDELDRGKQVYDVTLLINLCVGLITIPNEYSKRSGQTMEEYLTKKYGGLKVRHVLPGQEVGKGLIKEQKTVYRDFRDAPYALYLRKLRNALSHGRVELLGSNKTITSVRFSDRNNSEIELYVEELKKISRSIANVHLNFFDFVTPKKN